MTAPVADESGFGNSLDVSQLGDRSQSTAGLLQRRQSSGASASAPDFSSMQCGSDVDCLQQKTFMKSRKFSHMDVKELCAPEVTPSDAACLQRALKNCRTRSLLSLPLAPPEVLASDPALLSQFDTRSYSQAPPLKHDSTRPADMLSRALHALGSGVGPSLGASRSASEKHSRSSSSVGVATTTATQQQQQQAVPQAAAAFSSNAASNSSSSSGAVKPGRPSLGRRRSSGGLGVALSSVLGLAGVQRRHIVENIQFEDISDKLYLAQGAMCDVFKGRLMTGEVVIVKTPRDDAPETAANDLECELLLLKELTHPNIIAILFAGHHAGRRFIGLEALLGGTLADRVEKLNRKMPIVEVVRNGLDMANAMNFLHDEAIPNHIVIHRDLKPDNVCFDSKEQLKILDFGLAKVVRRKYRNVSEAYSMTSETGSPRFMAPEVGLGKAYNEKVDVYSWALICWFILTRSWPYKHATYEQFSTAVFENGERPAIDSTWPLELRELLEDCWSAQHTARPTFAVIVNALEGLLANLQEMNYSQNKCCTTS